MARKAKKKSKPAPAVTPLAMGERVRVAKKSVVVDKERGHENLSEEDRVPLEADVTGIEGEVYAPSYESTTKDGERCVPIRLPNNAVISVPENRLEPVDRSPRSGYSRRYAEGWDRAFGSKKRSRKRKAK